MGHHHYSRIGIVRRGDCMFIEKARHLQNVRSIGGIVIDHNTSIKSSNNQIFSMTGDGNNDVQIPLVLMFKDEAFQLLNLLSHQSDLIVYIGEERRLAESFYEQIDFLDSIVPPFNQNSSRWIYGQLKSFEFYRNCRTIPMRLKSLEALIQSKFEVTSSIDTEKSFQIERFLEIGKYSKTRFLFDCCVLSHLNFHSE